ncbi:MAG: class I SAM-dependent methyltransferase [Acidobacteriota bacterium]|nr:class I SAM-dependent methyltransferase [Acidobacteriota bacterium]
MSQRTIRVEAISQASGNESESLFERVHWLYAFCREHLFRDDTEQIAVGLWPDAAPPPQTRLLEIGCGPGFYSRQLAARFSQLNVTGIDRAPEQLKRARARVTEKQLNNCHFEKADVLSLKWPHASFQAVVASRLFTILPEREQALAEMHRVLHDGGRCFIAEPRSLFRAAIPLHVMWLVARLIGFCRESPGSYREPRRVAIMTNRQFGALIASQPWRKVRHWHDAWYQYAICEKDFDTPEHVSAI